MINIVGVGLRFSKGSNSRSSVMDKFGIGILNEKGVLVRLLTVKLQKLFEFWCNSQEIGRMRPLQRPSMIWGWNETKSYSYTNSVLPFGYWFNHLSYYFYLFLYYLFILYLFYMGYYHIMFIFTLCLLLYSISEIKY